MNGASAAMLGGWHDFYLVTGTAAAALTALQFVTQSLLGSSAFRTAFGDGDPEGGIGAFGTPTVVHFTLALLLSAGLCAPWSGLGGLRATLALAGVGALGYSAVVLRRARRQRTYEPVAEDWLWHVVLPAVAYAAVLLGALLLGPGTPGPLFLVAAATLLLLCIGIHNSWDTVTYLTVAAVKARAQPAPASPVPHDPTSDDL